MYTAPLFNENATFIQFYLSETQNYVSAYPLTILDGLADLGGFITILTFAVMFLQCVHFFQYEKHLRKKFRPKDIPNRRYNNCFRTFWPTKQEKKVTEEISELISIERFYKISKEYD